MRQASNAGVRERQHGIGVEILHLPRSVSTWIGVELGAAFMPRPGDFAAKSVIVGQMGDPARHQVEEPAAGPGKISR